MKPQHRRLFEKIFTKEIEGSLPWQGKSKYLEEMEREGFIERMERTFGGPPFPVTCTGWAPTHKGRMVYGDWAVKHCKEVDNA